MSKTIADAISTNVTMFVNCGSFGCWHSVQLDLHALAARLGADHGALHPDLVGLFRCTACERKGRPRKPVHFTIIPDYEGDTRRRNARLG